MKEAFLPYHDRIADLAKEIGEHRSQGIVVLDASILEEIEDEYGADAYGEVRQRLLGILEEQRGKDYRAEDVITLDKPRGLRVVVFLDRKRRRSQPSTMGDLKTVRSRMMASLAPNLARAAFPYIKGVPRFDIGYAMAVHNPLMHAERIVRRAVRDALAVAAHHRQAEEL